MSIHTYNIEVIWSGNKGVGTSTYESYGRDFEITADGKPEISGSADSQYRGNPDCYNPEEFLLASISSCHMLWYLHLCADNGIIVEYYSDSPSGVLKTNEKGNGKFDQVSLKPKILIKNIANKNLAEELHEQAHAKCFIANSVNFKIKVNATIGAKSSN